MIIQHATIINEGERFTGSLLIREGRIASISSALKRCRI